MEVMKMENKRLMRSRSDRMFLGVAGGLGTYLNVDPVLVRLFFVLMGFATHGQALLVYLLLALLMPEAAQPAAKAHDPVEEEIVIKNA
jgi:phage shock protein C